MNAVIRSTRRTTATMDTSHGTATLAKRRKSRKRTSLTAKKKSQNPKLAATRKGTLKTEATSVELEPLDVEETVSSQSAFDPEQSLDRGAGAIAPLPLISASPVVFGPIPNQPDCDAPATASSCDTAEACDQASPVPAAAISLPDQTCESAELVMESPNDESIGTRRPWAIVLQTVMQAWSWIQQKIKCQRTKKRLRVCESVSLGEKRFIAVIQVDGEEFLVGGSSSSVSTLAHLERPQDFAEAYRVCQQDLSQA